jgi:hypothetical protein
MCSPRELGAAISAQSDGLSSEVRPEPSEPVAQRNKRELCPAGTTMASMKSFNLHRNDCLSLLAHWFGLWTRDTCINSAGSLSVSIVVSRTDL